MKFMNLSKFPSLKVPVLNHQATNIPINTHDLMIYSYLLFRSRKNKGGTQDQIRRSLFADTVTARTHLSNLEKHHLAEKRGRVWFALEPNDETQGWFKKIEKPKKPGPQGFWDRLVYTTVYLPTKEARTRGITATTNLIYWKLVQWSSELSGTNGTGAINPGSGRKPERLTNRYLVRALRADPKTIRRSLESLIELRLIKKVPLHDGCYFAVTVFPLTTAIRDQLWRSQWKDKKPIVGASLDQLLGVGTKAVALPEKENSYLDVLMRHKVPKAISDEIMLLTKTSGLEFFEWCSKFEKCQKDNATNLAMGKTEVPHPGRLFLYELKTLAKTDGVRNLCDREATLTDSDETAAQEMLRRVPGRSLAMWELLKKVVNNKSLKAADGTTFPVALSWIEVRDLAIRPGITFEAFQRDVAKKMFTDPKNGICSWLDRWLALSPVPEISAFALSLVAEVNQRKLKRKLMEWTSQYSSEEATCSHCAQLVIDATVKHCKAHEIKRCTEEQLLILCKEYWDRLETLLPSGDESAEPPLDLLKIELEPYPDHDNIDFCPWDPEADTWEPIESLLIGQLR